MGQGPRLLKLRSVRTRVCGMTYQALESICTTGGYTSRTSSVRLRDLTENPENGHNHFGVRATQQRQRSGPDGRPPSAGMQSKGAGSPASAAPTWLK